MVCFFSFIYLLTTAYIYDFISNIDDINKYPHLPKWNDSDRSKYQNYIDQSFFMFCWLSDEDGNGPILENWIDYNTMFDEIIPLWELNTDNVLSNVVFLSSSKFFNYKNLLLKEILDFLDLIESEKYGMEVNSGKMLDFIS